MSQAKQLIFSFDELSVKDKAAKKAMQYFTRAGLPVVSQDVDTKIRRTSGISFREMLLTFADSQTVTLRIKQSGDIYQVLVNNKAVPLANQDDHVKAIADIVKLLDAQRTKFQKKMALAKVKLPPSIRTAAPKLEAALDQKIASLNDAIAAVDEEIALAKAA